MKPRIRVNTQGNLYNIEDSLKSPFFSTYDYKRQLLEYKVRLIGPDSKVTFDLGMPSWTFPLYALCNQSRN